MSAPLESCFCEPYPELTSRLDQSHLHMKTPWLAITAEVEPDAIEFAAFCTNNLQNPVASRHVSEFLKPFVGYPIAFIRQHEPNAPKFRPRNMNLFEFCRTPQADEFDGLAALTFLRHEILAWEAHQLHQSHGSLKISELSLDVARKAVLQNYYVTSRCDEILSKAIKKFPDFDERLADFRREEAGHDKLLKTVIDKVGSWQGGVLKETKSLVALLEDSIDHGILAFAVSLEVFEGVEFSTPNSPLAQLVGQHFSEDASRPLQKHYAINRQHSHGQIGIELMQKAGMVGITDMTGAQFVMENFKKELGSFYSAIFQ